MELQDQLKRAKSKNLILTILLVISILLSILFFFFGLIQRIEAALQAKLAIENERVALAARSEAEVQRQIAMKQAALAEEQLRKCQGKK